jgi:hypothetical protein
LLSAAKGPKRRLRFAPSLAVLAQGDTTTRD